MILIKYLILFLCLIVAFHLYNRLALLYNIVDVPNKRSSHERITVRGGGIIFPISIILWFITTSFQFPWFFSGLILISLVSFLDDLYDISFKNRLIVHILSLTLLCNQLELYLFPWWIWLPVMILLTGIINAFNFMDGINGITGGYSLAILFGVWYVNNFQANFIGNELIYFTSIAVIVFNYYNFRENAKCFAGDVGSISIAFIIIFLLGKLIIHTNNILYLLFLLIYGIDTIYTIVYRIILKENIFKPHRMHLYQLLANENKIPHTIISFAYSIVQIIINVVIIVISSNYGSPTNNIVISLIFITVSTLIFHFIRQYVMHKTKSFLHNVSTK